LNNLIFVFIFIFFMILRVVLAKNQSEGRKRRGRGVPEDSQGYTVPPVDEDGGEVSPSFAAPPELPRDIPVRPAERFLRDTEPFPRDLRPSLEEPAKSAPGKTFPQNLDHLPPLKRAVALAEILGQPLGL
jgi:hypothetical protein